MAKQISSKLIGLYVNQGTTAIPAWSLFACSTSDGFSGTTDTVTIASKCEGDWLENLPTDKSWEFSNSSYAIKDLDLAADQVSHNTAFDLWQSGEQKEFKLASADGVYLRQGLGTITGYNEGAESSDYLQFDLTITGSGPIVSVVV